MANDYGLGDLRFQGYSYQALAAQLDALRGGPGSDSLDRAVGALKRIADGLDQTDRTLRQELAKIGVEWEGDASQRGQEATKAASVYAEDAGTRAGATGANVGEQGAVFDSTRHAAPQGGELRGPTQTGFLDDLAGTFGYTTDNARRVEETRAAHDAAAAAMNDYSRGSQSAIGGAQALPVPPGLDLVAQPAQHLGGTSAQSFTGNPGSFTPSGAAGAPGSPGSVGLAAGNQAGVFSGVNGGGGPGGSGSGGAGGNNLNNPGNFNNPGGVNSPPGNGNPVGNGRIAGIGPTGGSPGGLAPGGGGLGGLRPGFGPGFVDGVATAAGIAGAGGAGAGVGSALEKDRLVRGGGAKGVAGAAGVDGSEARNNRSAIAGAPEEEARAARNAERLGGTRGGRGSSLMSPAAAGAGAPGEDDDEHVRKYGIDSEDVFGDERLVVSPVLGQDD
ncbi:PE-PGRS virulence associated protein [Actinokineospora spheciospongiae]|uniref:PE-PGRS virulence associated protein n=1 Tax=Actinokineospora spheciospongiae TaxID=909613 RepID=W7IY42_9PSEU|nr:PPE domain-containing protein [Actinokineospora spheciospongiae]EWC58969.1 PE-PGRS virulence associated protein [Actinokineospora spheciospongiae]PWW61760.1 PPE family protein [Actinokineospora spheciospongiae]